MSSTQKNTIINDDWKEFLELARDMSQDARQAFRQIRIADNEKRSQVLIYLAEMFENKSNQDIIITENKKDLEIANKNKLSGALTDRLALDTKKILDMANSLREISGMSDPVGEIISGKKLKSGIDMIKKRVPLGVVFTIYESRPNVTVDIGALCIKSGNAAILRGGKEAIHSNKILHNFFMKALSRAELPKTALQLITDTNRSLMLAFLKLDDLIDVVVPRGGEALIRFTAQNSSIPVIKHDKGVCNLYIDSGADLQKAIAIAINAKMQRPSLCNAIENLIIHKDFAHSKELLSELKIAGVRLLACEKSMSIYSDMEEIVATDLDETFHTEFLDERLSVKTVENFQEALDFIHIYGSGHSEIIITENIGTAQKFCDGVDTAALLVNCSSRFHDGGQMGMGAEVGISTGRLHVRGPMGLSDLTTSTYIMSGDGQIRS